MSDKRLLLILCVLSAATLFTPFIWMKIGPLGKAFYGPNVPDIYILGYTVLGKNMSCPEIGQGDEIQRFFIFLYVVNALVSLLLFRRRLALAILQLVNLGLLLCFPLWLWLYADAIFQNSDGATADMKIYPHVGLLLYAVILVLQTVLIARLERCSPRLPDNRT